MSRSFLLAVIASHVIYYISMCRSAPQAPLEYLVVHTSPFFGLTNGRQGTRVVNNSFSYPAFSRQPTP